MFNDLIADSVSAIFTADDISNTRYAKIFSVKKIHTIKVIFALFHNHSVGGVGYKRLCFLSGLTPNIYDLDYDSSSINVKVLEDTDNYYLYAKTSASADIKFKIIHASNANLIKLYPATHPVALPSLTDVTNIARDNKVSKYYSIASLITTSTGWTRTYPTSLMLSDDNNISGFFYIVEGATSSGHADGTQIATFPVPWQIDSEALFVTFTAQYQATDNLWYGCTIRVGKDQTVKVYDIRENAPTLVKVRANINYRCSKALINSFINT